MAEKKEPMHKRAYKGSPRIEADDDGKKVIKKGPTEKEKESAKTASGTEGMAEHDKAVMKIHQKHSKERMDMHHRHEKEHQALMHKSSMSAAEGSPAEEASESPAEAEQEGD